MLDSETMYNWVLNHGVLNFNFNIVSKDIRFHSGGINGVRKSGGKCDLTIDVDELEKLIQIENQLKSINEKIVKEQKIRDQNTSVQKAYEQYQILLNLAQNGE